MERNVDVVAPGGSFSGRAARKHDLKCIISVKLTHELLFIVLLHLLDSQKAAKRALTCTCLMGRLTRAAHTNLRSECVFVLLSRSVCAD